MLYIRGTKGYNILIVIVDVPDNARSANDDVGFIRIVAFYKRLG